MAYDQRMHSGNPVLTGRPQMTSSAVTNPGSSAPGAMGAFAPPGGNPQGSVASGGYPPPNMSPQMMGQGMPDASMGMNPALMQLAQNIQNQQPYAPGLPTAGQPALGGNAVGMGMGARGAFAGPGAGSAMAMRGRR